MASQNSVSVPQRPSGGVGRIIRSTVFAIIALIAASFAFVGVQAPQHTQFSPYDEYVYFDYLVKVPTEGFIRIGEETGPQARNELSCIGVYGYTKMGQACDKGSHAKDSAYPYDGGTGATIYSPAYFAVTRVLAEPLTWTGMGLLEAARLVGAVWLAAGLILVFLMLKLLKVDALVSLGLALSVVALPVTYWSNTYISTDAPTVAAAAGIACLGILAWRRRANPFWLVLAAIVLTLFKVQNLAAVGIVALCLLALAVRKSVLARAHEDGRGPGVLVRTLRDSRSIAAILSVVAGVLTQAAWLFIISHTAIPGTHAAIIDTQHYPLTGIALATETFRFITAFGGSATVTSGVGLMVAGVLTLLTIAATVGLVMQPRRYPPHYFVIAASTLLVSLLLGPALALAMRVEAGYYVPLPVRYGYILVPALLACLGLYLNRYARVVPIVVAAAGAVSVLGVLR